MSHWFTPISLDRLHLLDEDLPEHLVEYSRGQQPPTNRPYPRPLVGETGGKDFVVAHSSANPDVLRTALVRGAFEYSGQKCSAASRAYIARSVWDQMGDELVDATESLKVGDVRDLSNFTSAVIDRRAFTKHVDAIERARDSADAKIIAGGVTDDREGWYIRPTLIISDNPKNDIFTTEYFGLDTRQRSTSSTTQISSPPSMKLITRLRTPSPAQSSPTIGQSLNSPADGCGTRLETSISMTSPPALSSASSHLVAPSFGHERQGGLDVEPDPLDESPVDQREICFADRPHLPPHGLTERAAGGRRSLARAAKKASAACRVSSRASDRRPPAASDIPPSPPAPLIPPASFPSSGIATFNSPLTSTTLPRPPAASCWLPLKVTGWPSTVIDTVALREPSDEASVQTISSLTVSWGPVNRAAESGAGNVREVLLVEPSTETW